MRRWKDFRKLSSGICSMPTAAQRHTEGSADRLLTLGGFAPSASARGLIRARCEDKQRMLFTFSLQKSWLKYTAKNGHQYSTAATVSYNFLRQNWVSTCLINLLELKPSAFPPSDCQNRNRVLLCYRTGRNWTLVVALGEILTPIILKVRIKFLTVPKNILLFLHLDVFVMVFV